MPDALTDYRHGVSALKQGPATTRPRRVLDLLRTLPALWRETREWPVLELALPPDHEGEEIRRALRERTRMGPVNTFGAGVLTLPEEPEAYLRGRRRQAVRTMCNHARKAGIVTRAARRDEVADIARSVLAQRPTDAMMYLPWIEDRARADAGVFWLAEDADGRPLALAAVTVASDAAWLAWTMSAEHDLSSQARFALAASLHVWLASQGVRHLLTDTVLSMPPGLVYFQRRLGFEPRRVRVSRGPLVVPQQRRPT